MIEGGWPSLNGIGTAKSSLCSNSKYLTPENRGIVDQRSGARCTRAWRREGGFAGLKRSRSVGLYTISIVLSNDGVDYNIVRTICQISN